MSQTKVDSLNMYRDFESFLDTIEHTDPNPDFVAKKPYLSSQQTGYHDWDFNAGYEGTLKLAREGWPEGLKKIKKALPSVRNATKAQTRRKGFELRPDGLFPNVSAYASGSPFCMNKRAPGTRSLTRTTRITYQACFHAGVSASDQVNFGAALLSLVTSLERKGDSVDLVAAYDTTDGKGSGTVHRVRIKRSGRRVDLDRLAFAMIHPGMFRRLVFAAFERDGWFPKKNQTGHYGYPGFVETPEDGIRITNAAQLYKAQTFESALKHVVDQYNGTQSESEKI